MATSGVSGSVLLGACLVITGCGDGASALHGELWTEADALFHQDPRWIGGDGAHSVDLGDERVLWAFGDSIINQDRTRESTQSRMIRNSVAIQTGYDPSRAFMRFYWQQADGEAGSYLPEDGEQWYWPGDGVRRGDRLLWFVGKVYQRSPGAWGFASAGSGARLVDNPDDEPTNWNLMELDVDAPSNVDLGTEVIVEEPWLYVYGISGDAHSPVLVRYDVERAFAGDFSGGEWWTGDGFGSVAKREPLFLIGAPSFSVTWAEPLESWVFCSGFGFGPNAVTVRTAPALTGPWSQPTDVIRPPESFWPDAFVYAVKAHAELEGADLVATYVPESYADLPPSYYETLYYPHFVRISYR